MASLSGSRVEFPPASINKVLDVPPYQPNSHIHSAIGLLTGTGEGDVDPKSISIIPVDLSGNNSVLIRFKKPVMPYVPKAKGLDNHELRIQKLSDTEPRPDELDRASRDGLDTGHDALIASMNGIQQNYFSTTEVLPSTQLIRVRASNGDYVEIPLYIPILFFGPSGKKSVALLTRFPREYIGVEVSKSIDKPVGVVRVDENKIIRPPAPSGKTFEWAFRTTEEPVPTDLPVATEQSIPIPVKAVPDNLGMVQIDFAKIEADRASKTPLETIVSGVDAVMRTREAKRLFKVLLDDTNANNEQRKKAIERWKLESRVEQQKVDSPVVLFREIAEFIVSLQNQMDTMQRTNGSWLQYRTGPFLEVMTYAWRVSLYEVNENIRICGERYRTGIGGDGKAIDTAERRKNYIKYAGLKQLVDSEWVVYKKWKN